MSDKKIKHLEAEVRQSRALLANRWNALELEVAGLANTAKEEVTQTVQQAKESISLRHQIAKRPWMMLAGSIATGLLFSKMRSFKSLAVLGLATPIFKNALNSESLSQAFRSQRSTSYSGHSSRPSSSTLKGGGFVDIVKTKAFKSLAELAREFAGHNLPRSVMPVVDQAISHTLNSLLGEEPPRYSASSAKASQPSGDENDAFSIH